LDGNRSRSGPAGIAGRPGARSSPKPRTPGGPSGWRPMATRTKNGSARWARLRHGRAASRRNKGEKPRETAQNV
jgi:hypothetical protein